MRHSSLDTTMHSARERTERTSRGPKRRVPVACDGETAHTVCTESGLVNLARAVKALMMAHARFICP